jgi:hypothetical protein
MATASKADWDLAEKCRELADTDLETLGKMNSMWVVSAVVFCCSAVEALANERLSLRGASTIPLTDRTLFSQVRGGQGEYRKFIRKLRDTVRLLSGKPAVERAKRTLDDFGALIELRNALIHYNPEFSDIYHWPERIRRALKLSRAKMVRVDWLTAIGSVEILRWASSVSASALTLFLNCTGEDPEDFFG